MRNGKNGRRVFVFMLGLFLFAFLFAAAAYFISVVMTNWSAKLQGEEPPIPVSSDGMLPVLIVDPGHGGEDGGSSSGETLEKDLNLELALALRDICDLTGLPVKLTRESDTALYDLYGDLDDYSGKKKIYDLKNRVRFATEEGGVYLGIHMNKFPDAKYRGLQVYYSPNDPGSVALADAVADEVNGKISPWNGRKSKKATSAIFVLDRLKIPAVLVECGFLSNPEDLEALCDPSYRASLASAIFSGAAKYETGASGY
ncbi:MAG: N-acetylmuramoyl-L-alanine amidase [Clostridia bacterium]|nr:N-acetylmuramoyl-L-alanine amidase [Clostridia bacterium]